MKHDGKSDLSYDRLNAFVDDELDRFDEARVLDAVQTCPELEQQVCELRLTKHLVRHAYQHEASPRSRERARSPDVSRWLAAAAVALLAVGAGGGWLAHDWQQGGQQALPGVMASLEGLRGTEPGVASERVVLHVSSAAPDRVVTVLDEAEAMLRRARSSGRAVSVEIVANNSGLDILRADVSPYATRIEALHTQYPNLTLVACGLTLQRLREQGVVVRLLPDTVVATSALDQILQRIHEGWTYVRT